MTTLAKIFALFPVESQREWDSFLYDAPTTFEEALVKIILSLCFFILRTPDR